MTISDYLNYKKGRISFVTLCLLACIILFTGFVYFISTKKNTNPYPRDSLVTDQANIDDTDGDGLLDWQEDLYGTSKKLRDTDGDRITDAQEIERGWDPLVYGEGISAENILPQEKIFEDPTLEFDTPTPLREESQINNNLETNETDPELKNTLNSLGIIVQNSYTSQSQDMELFGRLFSKEFSSQDKVSLIILAEKYTELSKEIDNSISHPQINIEIKNLSKNYQNISESIWALLDSEGLEIQEFYQKVLVYNAHVYSLQETLLSIHNYVKGRSITFSDDEPGSFFLFAL